jgi:hypothetical protein
VGVFLSLHPTPAFTWYAPFGLGLAPLPGLLGRVRDAALRPIVMGMIERTVLPPGNRIRESAGRRRSLRRMSSCGGLR